MAIYSLRLTPIGKTTQKAPFTAAAHVRYITRATAASVVISARMPDDPKAAMRWLRQQEREDRVNARVADKLVIALPRELSLAANAELLRRFAETLTQARVPWLAAIHAKGKDRHNPHGHLIVRDRDPHTRKRVLLLSAGPKEARQRATRGQAPPTTLEQVRQLWEETANQALTAHGRSARIDRRRLVEQGQHRLAQVHEGPNIRAMHARGVKPVSKTAAMKNRALRKKGTPVSRLVHYTEVDGGMTRVEYNAYVRDAPGLSMTEVLRQQERVARRRRSATLERTPERSR